MAHGGRPRAWWDRLDVPGRLSLLVALLVVVLNLAQQPGRITFDTKLDLQLAPLDFLVRSLGLWNADSALGGLQNQASGYLFPMGPVFVLGDVVGIAPWVWERLWSAAVMLLAFEGARRLARAWPGMDGWGALVAGLAFMLAPRVLTTAGVISGETLPSAVLPWTVLPLVLYLRGSWRRWPALVVSATSVLLMGGQNAVLVVACLVLPGLMLLLGGGRSRRTVTIDVAAWSGLVVVACAWWLVPLLLLGAYAPPFLDFIESSRNTASDTGWLSSLRGTDHWVAFFPDGGAAGWVGGWELASSPWLLVTTVAVAGLGLVGLVLGRPAFIAPLVVSMLLGLAVLTAGSGGVAGSPMSEQWLDALDGALAPLRNVHKFDPLVRLPLSLGLGILVSVVLPRLARPVGSWAAGRVRSVLVGVVVLLVVAAAQPALAGHLRTADGMDDIAASWRQAADYLDSLEGPTEVLVLPGSGFAVQTWGRTVDEPLQVLGGPPWLARAQVTVAPPGTLRVLDALERRVAEGRPVPRLGGVLRRLGITHVVVRSDLDPDDTDAPDPARVRATLVESGGLAPLAAFADAPGKPVSLEVLGVVDPRDPRVSLQSWNDRTVVRGGPESLIDLVSARLLAGDRAAVLTGSEEAAGRATQVLTDSARRVERSFGRVHEAVSAVMTAVEPFRVQRRVHDYLGDGVPELRTVAEYDGVDQVLASTSTGYADTFGPVRPEGHPWAALDDSVFTAWETEPFAEAEGQWIELRFERDVRLGDLGLQFDPVKGADVVSVRLISDGGSRVVDVGSGGRLAGAELPTGTTRRLRVVVEEAIESRRPVRLSDLRIEGLDVRRTLHLPGELQPDATLMLRADAPRRACTRADGIVTCSRTGQVDTTETRGFSRSLTVAGSGSWEVRGRAVATHGTVPIGLFAPLSPTDVAVLGSSTFAGDPAVGPAFAYDGRPETSWYASPVDPDPVLELSWADPRTITGLSALLAPDAPGRLPESLLVDPMDGRTEPQLVALTGPDAGRMEPVRKATRLRLTAVSAGAAPTAGSEGVGVSELSLRGLNDLRHSPDPSLRTGAVCGFGPSVEVDGRTIPLRIRGSLDDVVSGRPLRVSACGMAGLRLAAGERRITVESPDGFSVTELWLRPVAGESAAQPRPTTATASVDTWGATDRSVEVTTDGEAVLAVAESFNAGWEADLDGATLRPVLVDGWKQGFVVPASSTGRVALHYAPQGPFVAGIVTGGLLAALLVVASVLLWRRRLEVPAPAAAPQPRSVGRPLLRGRGRAGLGAVGALVLAVVSLPLAVGALTGAVAASRGPGSRLSGRVVRWAPVLGGVAFAGAVALTLVLADSVLDPPETAEVLVAWAVGLAVGLLVVPRSGRGARSASAAEHDRGTAAPRRPKGTTGGVGDEHQL